jgi:hypothetical protein
VTAQKQMGARMSQAAPIGDASIPAAAATDAFIAEISWRPLFVGVMIGVEAGRMTSRFGESRVPKYGGFFGGPKKGVTLCKNGCGGSAEVNRPSAKAKRQ